MTTPCSGPRLVTGPFPQTLFMGASIRSFNLNLGWGAEPSTCTVQLVRDLGKHRNNGAFDAWSNHRDSILNTSTSNSTSNALNPAQTTIDGQRNLHKNIYKKLKDRDLSRRNDDITNTSEVKYKDTGKKIWLFNNNTPVDRTTGDPGFLADLFTDATRNIDVMGSPVHFRFDDVIFNGIVKTWNYSNGGIEVQIQSPTNLVKGTKLILKDYFGTVSTTVLGGLAVPYDDSTFANAGSVENIYAGNVPNIINIFGYAGMQNLGYTEDRGVSLGYVYDYVAEMFGDNPTLDKWNPYGAIVGKAARDRVNGTFLTPSTSINTIGGSLTANHYNIIGAVPSADTIDRPLFSLDLSDVPRPPNQVYINEDSISLLDFIDRCCEPVGLDFWVELIPPNSSASVARSAIIKINTISRRYQPAVNTIRDLMQNWDASDYVIDYKFGQEFQDTKTRSIIVGGNQQRLIQVGNYNLSRYQHRRVYEPTRQSFVNFQYSVNQNQYREPDTSRYRNTGNTVIQRGGAVTAQDSNNFYTVDADPFSNQSYHRGSYYRRVKPTSTTPIVAGSTYNISTEDFIKPYFGRHLSGGFRTVIFNQGHGELKVSIDTSDLSSIFPANSAPNTSQFIFVGETEIRCAMAGMDSWLNYIFEMPQLGKALPMSTYIYDYISAQNGPSFATTFFLNAMGVFSGNKGKMRTLPAVRTYDSAINLESYLPFSEGLYPILEGLHSFVAKLGSDYYGKKFMVRLPIITSYVDNEGVRVYSYEVTDKAWEEPNNYIDDSIVIGGDVANGLANEDGTFGPLIGYDDSAEYDAYFSTNLNDNLTFVQSPSVIAAQFFSRKNSANWYWPLQHDIDPEDVYYLPWSQSAGNVDLYPAGSQPVNPAYPNITTAHGISRSNNQKWKMYTRATLEDIEQYAKTNTKLTFAYGMPHAVISVPSPVTVASPTHLIKVMCEEYFIHNGLPSPTDRGAQSKALGMMLAWSIAEKGLGMNGTLLSPPLGNQNNMRIAPRAAAPIFAAIPIKSNLNSYGPWTSNPGRGFQTDNNLFNDPNPVSQINNLVGEVNYTRDEQAVPWNYGGINAMDASILTKLKDSNYYQQVLENGTVTIAGVLFKNTQMGGFLAANGPIVNSINVQIGNDGFTTTYSMRTYNKKIGFYNKEDAENIQRVNRKFIENRQENIKQIKEIIKTTRANTPGFSSAKGMSTSPMNILVGAASPFLNANSVLTETNLFDDLDFRPEWGYRPYMGAFAANPVNHMVQKTNVVLYDEQEMPNMLVEEYNRKSFMSLDGIFSPISFYPTPYAATYAQTLYDRNNCPYCEGQGTYKYIQLRPSLVGNTSSSDIASARTLISTDCRFCTPDPTSKNRQKGALPGLVEPPYIIFEGSDLELQSATPSGAGNIINKFTLNPVVMQHGEFALTGARVAGDLSAHSIDVVAFGEVAPINGNSLRAISSTSPTNNYAANVNQRFMGLRGPMMLHAWGYDKQGYPVPNSSGQVERKSDGSIRSITSEQRPDGSWTEPYKTKEFYKGWAQQPGTWPVGPIDLRWDDKAGVWTSPVGYRNTWVTIEIDLVGTQPTRGVLSGDDPASLPDGARRLVFVQDSAGVFSAPRGADIYCSYNPENGFYDPLYNRPLVTSGEIQGGASAEIYQSYKRGYDEADPDSYVTSYIDALSFSPSIGQLGLFVYINGSWVLQSVR